MRACFPVGAGEVNWLDWEQSPGDAPCCFKSNLTCMDGCWLPPRSQPLFLQPRGPDEDFSAEEKFSLAPLPLTSALSNAQGPSLP